MEIILKPFILFIERVFLLSYQLTDNYGWAIVLLSFVVSVLLLPVFVLIEKAKKKDDAVKQKMKPFVDEIKRCYKGQERFYYLKTLNRQFAHNPIRSLIPILSLLLQIPFFIAAYQYLEAFKPLAEVSFLFIKDLSLPDALFGAVNVLPIAMTVINLITAWFYTRHGNSSERRQMLIVAGVFLVLLFNLPSGLVLYWTMNNVFSFFRLFITNREVFVARDIKTEKPQLSVKLVAQRLRSLFPRLWRVFAVFAAIIVLVQINASINDGFEHLLQKTLIAIVGALAATAVFALLNATHHISGISEKKSLKANLSIIWPVFKPAFYSLAIFAVFIQLNWALQFSFDGFVLRLIAALAGAAILTGVFALTMVLFQNKKIRSKITAFKLNGFSKWLFVVLYFAFAATQVNWALNYYFTDIVLRLSIGAVALRLLLPLTILLAQVVRSNVTFSLNSFKDEFRKLFALTKVLFVLLLIFFLGSQIIWLIQNDFENGALRLSLPFVFAAIISLFAGSTIAFTISISEAFCARMQKQHLIALLFLSSYLLMASRFYFGYHNLVLRNIAFLVLMLTQVFAYIKLRNVFSEGGWARLIRGILIALTPIQLYAFLSQINVMLGGSITFSPAWLVDADLSLWFFFSGAAAVIAVLFTPANSTKKQSPVLNASWPIYTLAILYLVGFVFFWNPLQTYSSFPENFEFPAIEILKNNVRLFVIWTIVLLGAYLVLPKRAKWYVVIGMNVLVLLSFMHNTLIPIDLGSLQENKFLHEGKLAQPILNYLLEGVFIIAACYGVVWLFRKYRKQLLIGLVLLNVALVAQSLQASLSTKTFWTKPKVSADIPTSLTFSKDQSNVVVLIVDMFHGWYMDRILNEIPELAEKFEGFTWYPNTLSVSSTTGGSIGAIIGGRDYTIDKLNADEDRIIQEKITAITQDFHEKVLAKDWRFTSTPMIYSKIDVNTFDTYLPKWHDSWNQWNSELNIGLSEELGYTLLWQNALFYSAPLMLKPKVYSKGRWMMGEVESNSNTSQTQPYNFLRLLPYISNTTSDKPSFIYLHTYASHHPWDIIDDEGRFHPDVEPYQNNKWTIETIVKWIEWMKENGVYDNTKIVLLSDHGPHWDHFEGKRDMDIPFIVNEGDDVTPHYTMSQFALLMVKDFNSTNKLSVDNRFMSNTDAMAIAFDEDDPTNGEPKNRILPATFVGWERQLWLNNKIKIHRQYEVTNNMFDLKNWRRIDK